MITQKHLKKLHHYNPETGIFTWLVPRGGVKAGALAGYKNKLGYIVIRADGGMYYAHRLAWFYVYGVWPKDQIDHINHDPSDNRLVNLREATCRENGRNTSLAKNNISGVMGVFWYKNSKTWGVKVTADNKIIYLGSFVDWFEAVCARMSASNKYGFHPNHGRK